MKHSEVIWNYVCKFAERKPFFYLSVGEAGAGWPQGLVGVVKSAEAMGMEEGEAQWHSVKRLQSSVLCAVAMNS